MVGALVDGKTDSGALGGRQQPNRLPPAHLHTSACRPSHSNRPRPSLPPSLPLPHPSLDPLQTHVGKLEGARAALEKASAKAAKEAAEQLKSLQLEWSRERARLQDSVERQQQEVAVSRESNRNLAGQVKAAERAMAELRGKVGGHEGGVGPGVCVCVCGWVGGWGAAAGGWRAAGMRWRGLVWLVWLAAACCALAMGSVCRDLRSFQGQPAAAAAVARAGRRGLGRALPTLTPLACPRPRRCWRRRRPPRRSRRGC